ncbi:MAG: biotin/lipoate A/B protein ligase family protein [Smithellaceae bacterium]|nr:biotin/lipoate A/B protein ligase family protein [Smithellaceae bacterium]
MKTWLLLVDQDPLRGSLNMAVDEYLFARAGEGERTYLRFYQWEKPTVSLGYGQEAARSVDLDFCRANGIDIVRRMTGGKAVLHLRELTYSLASSDRETFPPTLHDSYRLISLALIKGLALMGLSANLAPASPASYVRGTMPCFAFPARGEAEIGGRKIIGSTQKRTDVSFLQHGSIPLDKDEALLKAVTRFDAEDTGVCMTSLSEALDRPVPFAWAVSRFSRGFAEFFGVELEPLSLDEKAWQEIAGIEIVRYGNDAWTLKR